METVPLCIVTALLTISGVSIIAGYLKWSLVDSTRLINAQREELEGLLSNPAGLTPGQLQSKQAEQRYRLQARLHTERFWMRYSLLGGVAALSPLFLQGQSEEAVHLKWVVWAASLLVGIAFGLVVIRRYIKAGWDEFPGAL